MSNRSQTPIGKLEPNRKDSPQWVSEDLQSKVDDNTGESGSADIERHEKNDRSTSLISFILACILWIFAARFTLSLMQFPYHLHPYLVFAIYLLPCVLIYYILRMLDWLSANGAPVTFTIVAGRTKTE
jgi:hypothetical protein